MTSQQFLVCDSSTVANFKQWAQAISTFFSTAGWVQTADTGQVNWSTISTVPGAGAYVYEVWKPGDALTVFYVKVEYGNAGSSTNCPTVRLSLATGTNGAGTVTGVNFGPNALVTTTFTPPSTTTQFECDFSGDAGRMCVMLWRNGTGNAPQFFAIERSLNASGVYTGAYATLYTVGNCGGNNSYQQTLMFAVGAAPPINHGSNTCWCLRWANPPNGVGAFNGSIPMDLCAPSIGFFDYPGTVAGGGMNLDFVDGVTFTISLYGSTRTYMAGKTYPFSQIGLMNTSPSTTLLMRYD